MSNSSKPFSQACENNKEPLWTILAEAFSSANTVLEIGSGTGQHAVYFAARLPQATWQTSDLPDNHPGIRAWLEEARLPNLHQPIMLDVTQQPWPVCAVDAVFSANTAHIMSWPQVQAMFRGIAAVLNPGGRFCLYGPFNYHGHYTSDSNARFDAWLKERNPLSGIRDFAAVAALAEHADLQLLADHAMPANNRTLVWQKAVAA
jgi:cyclopropane fatty-acyl-phospholipid synthase-like methyltransferase